ncbi:MAG: FAD-dependent oxidoreductase, partial [Thermoleophilia bacterium]|nr:FAD-dependent oxidoreductase [Thermoleophilia bacterium]
GCDLSERRCPARTTGRCAHCDPCDITCGWGGAGAFSDGKLTLSPEVGGWLGDYLDPPQLQEAITEVDRLWREFGAPETLYGTDPERVDSWRTKALTHRLRLIDSPIRHMGTERCVEVLGAMRRDLEGRVRVLTDTSVARLTVESVDGRAAGAVDLPAAGAVGAPAAGRRVTGVVTDSAEEFESPTVIVAPGREGAAWLKGEAGRLGLSVTSNAVDIGVRVEVPAVFTDAITVDLYEPKLLYRSTYFEDPVRTFCMNPHGVVSTESYGDVVTVNGHSYADPAQRTLSTNFALLVSTRFTQPFNDPIAYGKSIARLANLLGSDVIVQRLVDLQAGRRTTPERLARCTVPPTLPEATTGDLSFALPYRHQRDIFDMLEAMDGLLPGVAGRDTILYGVEVKFYSSRMELDRDLRTTVGGLYAVGDGAGVTRGLVQASASGLVAARAVLASLVG